MKRGNNIADKEMITAEDITDIKLTQAGYYWEMGFNEFDFSCKIKGEEDVLHLTVQRHDDGREFVIRSEKDDIWNRITGTEAVKLEDKLQEEVQYGNYHKKIGKLATLEDCKDMEYELMENDNTYLNRVIGKLWTELAKKQKEITGQEPDNVTNFRAETDKKFHKIDEMDASEIESIVADYVQSKIIENNLDVEIVGVAVSGSRCRGIEKISSDLDVVAEYTGSIREDDFFNMLHEDSIYIAGIQVDINPITVGRTGTLETYLPEVETYLQEKAQQEQVNTQFVTQGRKQKPTDESIDPSRMNDIPSISVNMHTEGTEEWEDKQVDILSGKCIDVDYLNYTPELRDTPKVQDALKKLIAAFPKKEINDQETNEMLAKQAEYKPLAKIEEQEEPQVRSSLKERLAAKQKFYNQNRKNRLRLPQRAL